VSVGLSFGGKLFAAVAWAADTCDNLAAVEEYNFEEGRERRMKPDCCETLQTVDDDVQVVDIDGEGGNIAAGIRMAEGNVRAHPPGRTLPRSNSA